MTARRYTQAQVAEIFAKAEASAEKVGTTAEFWDGYVLAYVAAALGVKVARHEAPEAAAAR